MKKIQEYLYLYYLYQDNSTGDTGAPFHLRWLLSGLLLPFNFLTPDKWINS